MRILALDTSTSLTGWAAGESSARPAFGSRAFPSTGDNLGRLSRMYGDWLMMMVGKFEPELIAYEEPVLYVSPERTQALTHYKLVGLGFKTEDIGELHGIPRKRYIGSTLKAHFSGHGRHPKMEMKNVARQLGYRVRDDNEADALAVFSKAVHEFDPENAHHWNRIGETA